MTDRIQVLDAIAARLNALGDYGATVEYDGWINIPFADDEITGERRSVAFGNMNEEWLGQITTEDGVYQGGFSTGIDRTSEDAEAIARIAHEAISAGQIEWE